MSKIADPKLAETGKKNFEWARNHMKTLVKLATKYEKSKALEGTKIGLCLHVTKETSVLVDSLLRCGAEVYVAAANPLSTSDDIAAYLSTRTEIWAWRGESEQEYNWCINQVLDQRPEQLIDDGADLHVAAHQRNAGWIRGGTEETTTGVIRLRALEREGKLIYPVIAVNDAKTKYLFDNRYGTGQSTLDGILRATSLLLSGKRVVVVGYGWVGRGIAMRARGMGSIVYVVEADPIRALEAYLDGFEVGRVSDFAANADIFITATGMKNVITFEDVRKMKEGAILANAGHFDVEIDVKTLYENASEVREVRPWVERIKLKNGKSVYLIAKGRVVNLVAAEGHPPEVMQMSFSNQFLSTIYIKKNHSKLKPSVIRVPEEIEKEVAIETLLSHGIRVEKLTKEQVKYMQSWQV